MRTLGIVAHGASANEHTPGQVNVSPRLDWNTIEHPPVADAVRELASVIPERGSLLWVSCRAGAGVVGARLLCSISRLLPNRWIKGYVSFGYFTRVGARPPATSSTRSSARSSRATFTSAPIRGCSRDARARRSRGTERSCSSLARFACGTGSTRSTPPSRRGSRKLGFARRAHPGTQSDPRTDLSSGSPGSGPPAEVGVVSYWIH